MQKLKAKFNALYQKLENIYVSELSWGYLGAITIMTVTLMLYFIYSFANLFEIGEATPEKVFIGSLTITAYAVLGFKLRTSMEEKLKIEEEPDHEEGFNGLFV